MPYKDRETHLRYMREYQAAIRRHIEKLRDTPCMDCGEWYPSYVMEFDHTRGNKEFGVNAGRGWKSTLEEIDKCDLVCANCHKVRTYMRRWRNGKRSGLKHRQRTTLKQ